MIGECLSNKNKIATVSKTQKILDLNKAQIMICEDEVKREVPLIKYQ